MYRSNNLADMSSYGSFAAAPSHKRLSWRLTLALTISCVTFCIFAVSLYSTSGPSELGQHGHAAIEASAQHSRLGFLPPSLPPANAPPYVPFPNRIETLPNGVKCVLQRRCGRACLLWRAI